MFKMVCEIISTATIQKQDSNVVARHFNASHLLLAVVRKIEGWPSKHTRWYDALTWLLKRGFELFWANACQSGARRRYQNDARWM